MISAFAFFFIIHLDVRIMNGTTVGVFQDGEHKLKTVVVLPTRLSLHQNIVVYSLQFLAYLVSAMHCGNQRSWCV